MALHGTAALWTNPMFSRWMLAGEKVTPGTRAFSNWVAAMPVMTGTTILQARDQEVYEALRERLNEMSATVPDIPNTPILEPDQNFRDFQSQYREPLV